MTTNICRHYGKFICVAAILVAISVINIHSVFAATAPGVPTVVSAATSSAGQAVVTFTAPVSNGGSTITSYTVTANYSGTYTPGGIIASGATSPITITGLTNGLKYYFTVMAQNAIGTSSQSSATNPIIPPISCPSSSRLDLDMAGEINNRIAGFSTSNPNFKSWYTTRGTPTGGWVQNVAGLWSNQISPIDLTGISAVTLHTDTTYSYRPGGTLISPRHMIFTDHLGYHTSVGDKVVFIDKAGNLITRTIVNETAIPSPDFHFSQLDSDVPTSITYYPILKDSDLQTYVNDFSALPMLHLDQYGNVNIDQFLQVTGPGSSDTLSVSYPASGPWAPYTLQPVGGDSGGGVFWVINGRPVLATVYSGVTIGPNIGDLLNTVNGNLNTLGGVYQATTEDVSCFTPYTPLSAAPQTFPLTENSPRYSSVGTVPAITSPLNNPLTYFLQGGNTDDAFLIDKSAGTLYINNPTAINTKVHTSFSLPIKIQSTNQYFTSSRGYTPTVFETTTTATVNVVSNIGSTAFVPPVWNGAWSQTTSGSQQWVSSAMSADGTKIIAAMDGVSNAQMKFSPDRGVTWQSVGPSKQWSWVAMSGDGLTAAASAGYSSGDFNIYVGTYSGGVWTFSTKSVGSVTPISSISMSADGSKMVAISNDGNIFISSNSGANWVNLFTFETNPNLTMVSMSASGGQIVVADQYGHDVHTYTYGSGSYTSGGSWTALDQSVTSGNTFAGLAISSDGTKIALPNVNAGTGNVSTGQLNGSTLSFWTLQTNSPLGSWGNNLDKSGLIVLGPSIAMSSDGVVIAAADDTQGGSGYITISTDSGVTWTQQTSAGSRDWSSISMSADGSVITATNGSPSASGSVWSSSALPNLSIQAPTLLTMSSAVLNGTLTNAGGSYVETTGFVYGLTSAYGATTTSSGTFAAGGLSASVSGLTCGTNYVYAAYAINYAGISYSPAMTLNIPCPTYGRSIPGGSLSSVPIVTHTFVTPIIPPTSCPKGYFCTPVTSTAQLGSHDVLKPVEQTFTRILKIGSEGSDVKALQIFLNTHGYRVATFGAGSPGHETMLFGAATSRALKRFQESNASSILAPSGLTHGTGMFGPATLKFIQGSI